MFTNWKTTSLGVMAIITAITTLVFGILQGPVTPELITGCASGILLGVGLLFAKDNNVTGGDVSNNLTVPNKKKP